MQPLSTTRQMMTWLGMCPADESATLRQNLSHIAHTSAILTTSSICFIASLAYCFKFISIDFDGAVFGFMAAIAEFGLIYVLTTAIGMRHQIGGVFTSLSTIYKSSKFNSKHQNTFWKVKSSFFVKQ